jgi:acyl transferase domain-containing protein/acyl-CoA synthetase (AMP-forming)/AMP-acid ligase II/pimeloyl-ACP methyl ester carboxylesterase/acyl carrier protein
LDKYHTFIDRLQGVVTKQPEKIALTFLQDGETESSCLNYGELQALAKAIAVTLQSYNATGERALLLYQPGIEFITAFLGCLYAGVIAVPAYPPRANRSIERLLSVVIDADAKFALTTTDLAEKIAGKFEDEGYNSLQFISTDSIAIALATEWKRPALKSETLAFLQYTSGSTGQPKGVMVSNGNLLTNSFVINRCFQNTSEQSVVSWLPPYHDMGLIGSIVQPFYIGSSLYMMPPVSFLQRPYRWLQAISKYGANISGGPNFAYDLCVSQITEAQKANLDLSCWQLAFSGAEPVRAETIKRFSDYFASCGFRRQVFYPCYGMAESTLMITGGNKQVAPIFRDFNQAKLTNNLALEDDSTDKVTLVSSGNNILGQVLAIVKPDDLKECAEGNIGEIWVSSDSVARGYWQKKEITDYAFAATLPNYPNVKFLRTGDLGFLKDGELFVTGRLKDLIIIRGRNYYPQDIELTVDNAHEAIRSGCGAAFAVEVAGEERLVITYEVQRTYLRKLDVAAVTKAIRTAILQNHELNPHAIVLLKTASVPKTSSGKIQRHACKAGFMAGTLDVVGEAVNQKSKIKINNQQPATSTVENWLIDNIAQRLGVAAREIDTEEPFASMGLDSVQAVRVSAELEDYLKIELSPTIIYDYPNISSLAAYLTNSTKRRDVPWNVPTNHPLPTNYQQIAIIGMACRFPGANNPTEFWTLLSEGKDAISECDRWSGSDYYGAIADVDKFDPQFFGISPREAQRMDPQQRLLLEVSWSALEDAAIAPDSLANSATGVFIGISSSDYVQIQNHYGMEFDAYGGTGNAHSIAANRLSYTLDLKGPSLSIDTACSSSLVAVHLAINSLRNGECTTAIVGGVNLMLSPELTQTFSLAGMMAEDGRCKTFDADADGYVRGEGCGVVILKPLEVALQEGDNVLAVIKGSAVNQDGRSNGLTAPNGLAQQEVIRSAIANAKITPEELSYIEAHGTGTKLGDPIEVNSLKAVLKGKHTCYLASVKTNIGHLEAAAGIAGLIKTVLCLQKETIPPHLNFKSLNPHIDFQDTPLAIPTESQLWQKGDKPRLAGISSFGFGGTNAHVIIGDVTNVETNSSLSPSQNNRLLHLLTLSAKNESALTDLVTGYQKYLETNLDVAIEDLCLSTNVGRNHFSHRLAITVESRQQLLEKINSYLLKDKEPGIVKSIVEPSFRAKIAWLFTGQGSQYVGMGYQLYQTQPVFRQALELCGEILQPYLDANLIDIIYPDREIKLNSNLLDETQYTQAAIFALEYALAQMWLAWGIKPNVVMGHSVGEYVAATIAGVFTLEDGLKLIAERGKLMQALPQNGSMFAIFSDEKTVQNLISPYREEVTIAAINGDHNIVISGANNAIAEIISKLEIQGINSKQLNVSHAFHSPLMQPILEDFRRVAETINYQKPQITIVSNVTGQIITEAITTAEYWVNHVIAPVRFIQGIKELQKQECQIFLEIGAKPILLGMGRNVIDLPQPPKSNLDKEEWGGSLCLPSLRLRKSDWSQILKSVTCLYSQGVKINWANFNENYNGKKIQLPTYPFQRQSYWLEVNEQSDRANSIVSKLNFKQRSSLDYYQIQWQLNQQSLTDLTPQFAKTGKWLIIGNSSNLETEITRQLEQYLDRYRQEYLVISSQEIETQLKEFLTTIGSENQFQGIIYLASLEEITDLELSTKTIEEYQAKNYTAILKLIQTLYQKSIVAPLWIVTRGAQKIENNLVNSSSILSNAFWGLGKVIASEHPESYGGIIDLSLQPETEEANKILTAITNSDREDYLVLRQDKIYLPRLTKTVITKQPLKINSEGAYLITGGLGSLGLQVAQWLVGKGAKYLILLGRSNPNLAAQKVIQVLESQGVTIQTVAADLADYEEVKQVIQQINVPLKGIIHSAGVLEDGLLQNQTWAKFQKVLKPKANGAWNLHLCTKNLDLDFLVFFSSIASLVGSPGQSNYAVANATLDAIANYRHSLGLPALSINWGAWDNGGMATSKGFNRQGLELIEPQQGLAALETLLSSNVGQIGVMSVDWSKLSKTYPYLRQTNYFARLIPELTSTGSQTESQTDVYRELLALPVAARETYLREYLVKAIAKILQVPPQNLTTSQSLFDLGMDSLMLMEAINQLKEDLHLMLYPREFYERPKITALAAYLASEFSKNHDKSLVEADVRLPLRETPLSKTSYRQIDREQPKSDRPIAFILSSPRSGSTLLRVMLAGHPDLVSPPELHLLPFATMQDRQQELATSYLGEGLQRALIELKGIDAAASQQLIAELVAKNVSTAEVYQMLQQLSGDRLLIDKSPTYANDINNLYAAEATFSQAKYIHLVRHPYAVIESFARMRMDKLLGTSETNPYRLAEAIWTQSNQNVLDFTQTIDTNRVLLVHYEELVARPESVMESICEFLAIPFRPEVLTPYQGNRMTDGVTETSMSIGDPNFRNRQQIDPQLADAWRNITLPSPLDYPARDTAALLHYELPQEAELTSEIEHKMEEILVNIRGLRVCLCTWGPKEGPVILCLHGILEQGAAWSEVAIRLAQKGYRVIAPDLRGHGKSDRVDKGGSYSLLDFLGDIDAIVEVLAGRAFTLVGHSLGSVVAAIFTSVRPQLVKNLVLIETILPTEPKEEDTAEQLATHLDYLASPPEHPVFPNVEAAAERLRQNTPALSKSLAMMLAGRITEPCEGGVRWRWEPLLRTRVGIGFNGIGRSRYLGLLKRIQVPITLIYGDRSDFNRNEDLTAQQSAMPNAEKVFLSGGHNLPLEAPSGIAKIISSAIALTTKLIP